jgi:glycosyltransferase involved in cell wall biosynthesis
MAVYAGDDAGFFAKAFSSTVVEQTVMPSQVVLVQDGPISDSLAAALAACVESSPVPTEVVVLPRNQGLTAALERGLDHCVHDIVARMDADDISLPDRFARQLPHFDAGVQLVGTGMLEFESDVGLIIATRIPPASQEEIAKQARFQQPFSHPTVMYRKDAVLAVGGYQQMGRMEDYWLFARMIHAGARVANVPEPLVMYRVGAGAYARRGGREQWRSELMLQQAFRRIGFTSRAQHLRNIVVRGGYRLIPEIVRKRLYRRFVAS